MNIRKIKGLKYPDEFFIKFFFKKGFDKKKNLTFLELGSSNGSNLMLPFQYDHKVIGVDMDKEQIQFANHNFKMVPSKNESSFYFDDMRSFVSNSKDLFVDVLLLPSSIYYISKKDFVNFLKDLMKNRIVKSGTYFYLRYRNLKDYRYGMGDSKQGNNSFVLSDNCVTVDKGLLNVFYDDYEMIEILQNELSISKFDLFSVESQNIENDFKIFNSDSVIWGQIN